MLLSFLLLLPSFFLASMQQHGFLAILAASGLLRAFTDIVCMVFSALEEFLMLRYMVILYLFNFVDFFFELQQFLFVF